MEFKDIQKKLSDKSKADLELLASVAGVPYHTVLKIANGQTPNPRIRTVEKLLRVFRSAA